MDEIKATLETMLNLFAKRSEAINKELECYPEGVLNHYNRNGRDNYFRNERINGRLIRHGITRNEHEIHQLARKRYIQEAKKTLADNIRIISQTINDLKTLDGDDILERMPNAYKNLPENFFLTRPVDMETRPVDMRTPEGRSGEQSETGINKSARLRQDYYQIASGIYVPDSLKDAAIQRNLTSSQKEQIREIQREWANQEYPKNTKNLEQKKIITSRGLKVRSMAESVICEALYEYDIPFRYDQLVTIGNRTISPDFSFLSIITGEIYWEHAGLTSNEKYVEYHRFKRNLYEAMGFVPWSNYIATYNEENGFFVAREIDSIIVRKLMRWLYLD